MNGLNTWVINMPCNSNDDARSFCDAITNVTRQGFSIESSGVNTLPSGFSRAWAILTKPEWLDKKEEQRK